MFRTSTTSSHLLYSISWLSQTMSVDVHVLGPLWFWDGEGNILFFSFLTFVHVLLSFYCPVFSPHSFLLRSRCVLLYSLSTHLLSTYSFPKVRLYPSVRLPCHSSRRTRYTLDSDPSISPYQVLPGTSNIFFRTQEWDPSTLRESEKSLLFYTVPTLESKETDVPSLFNVTYLINLPSGYTAGVRSLFLVNTFLPPLFLRHPLHTIYLWSPDLRITPTLQPFLPRRMPLKG